MPVYTVDGAGNIAGPATFTLALATASLAAGASTTPVVIKASKTYAFSYIFGGTSPSLKLQALGADGSTWQDIATVTATGSQTVDIFAGSGGAALRLTNGGANPITTLSASLVS